MYNGLLVGVGITTYNRRLSFRQLFDSIVNNSDVDYICIVKNKNVDYAEDDPVNLVCDKVHYINVVDDLGVGYCKNQELHWLIKQKNCLHLFLLEDDVKIKRNEVFRKYVETASKFRIQHMNWCGIPTVDNNPRYCVNFDNYVLDVYARLCGSFSYFTKNCIQQAGYIDDVRFVNAMEHIDHAYQISRLGLTLPFYSFADIHDSFKYLEYLGKTSTIDYDSILYKSRLKSAYANFILKNNVTFASIPHPTTKDVQAFLQRRIQE